MCEHRIEPLAILRRRTDAAARDHGAKRQASGVSDPTMLTASPPPADVAWMNGLIVHRSVGEVNWGYPSGP
jgi:hypothetical protein